MAQMNGDKGIDAGSIAIAAKLGNIESEIQRLEQEMRMFLGASCVSREYIAMQGQFGKLLVDLDSLDVTSKGREVFRQRRRVAINQIEMLATTLECRSHKDGRSCSECETRVT